MKYRKTGIPNMKAEKYLSEGNLSKGATSEEFLQVQSEGKTTGGKKEKTKNF